MFFNSIFFIAIITFTPIMIPIHQIWIIVLINLQLSIFAVSSALVIVKLVKSHIHYDFIMNLISTYLLFFSNIFYPASLFPIPLIIPLIELNPISLYNTILRNVISVSMASIGNYFFLLSFWAILALGLLISVFHKLEI